MAPSADGLTAWATDAMLRLGYVGVAFLTALDNVFPPVPSEIILPLAGFLAGQGHLSFLGVLLAATVGSVSSALLLYSLGRVLGESRLRRLIRRYGRWFFVSESGLDRAQSWFFRHGAKAVLFGRMVPLVRSLVSIPAGLARMSVWRFAAYTAAGSVCWNAVLIGLGWILGDQWELAQEYAGTGKSGILILVAFGIAWMVVRRWRAAPFRE